MSGFAGFFDHSDSLREDRYLCLSLVRRMLQRLRHRGNFHRREWISDACILAHADSDAAVPEPLQETIDGHTYAIAADCHLTNKEALCADLQAHGIPCGPKNTDARLILLAYLCYGFEAPNHLQGAFAFAIHDPEKNLVYLCRDRFGVKPLFFTINASRIAFASEIKALLEYPGVRPEIDLTGLRQLLCLAPYRPPGRSCFRTIREVVPGSYAVFTAHELREEKYFICSAQPHTDPPDETSRRLHTRLDDSPHSFTGSSAVEQIISRCWMDAILARDLPGTAAEDAQWMQILHNTSALDAATVSTFPLYLLLPPIDKEIIFTPEFLCQTLRPEVASVVQPDTFLQTVKLELENSMPRLRGESAVNRRRRQSFFAVLTFRLPLLLERMDRCTAWCGIPSPTAGPVPEDITYLFNVPAALLPENASFPDPFGKSALTAQVRTQLSLIVQDSAQPLHFLFSAGALQDHLSEKSDPQAEAYLLQLNLWMNRYGIRIRI